MRIRRRFLHNHDVEEELGSVLCSEQLESVVGECLPQRRFSPISDSCSRHTLGVVTPDVLRDETPAVTLASRHSTCLDSTVAFPGFVGGRHCTQGARTRVAECYELINMLYSVRYSPKEAKGPIITPAKHYFCIPSSI